MILFHATEAGGARELIPVITQAGKASIPHTVFCSAVTKPLFTRAGISATEPTFSTIQDIETYLETQNIHAVIVGTTGTTKLDKLCTAAARNKQIKSIAVLDEWYNYALRFQDEHGNLGTYLPDHIACQDELSKQLAIKEGLPEERLVITGSPALADVKLQLDQLRKNPPPLPEHWKGAMHKVLFLSEPLQNAYGKTEGSSGTHGKFLGFNENNVRQDIASLCTKLDTVVLEKLHPSEDIKEAPKHAKHWIVIAGAESLYPLLWHADVIIGMCSKTLLESVMLGKHPISYQPNAKNPELCTAVRLGLVPVCLSKSNLAKQIAHNSTLNTMSTDLVFADPNAATAIINLAA